MSIYIEIFQKEAKKNSFIDIGIEISSNFGVDGETAKEIYKDNVGDVEMVKGGLGGLIFARIEYFHEFEEESFKLLIVEDELIIIF